jgi:superfamily II DNA or RNA helicase
MEFLQLVRARGRRWYVGDERPYAECRLVTLNAAPGSDPGAGRAQASCRLLTPFDEILPAATVSRPQRVGRRQWRQACRALIASTAGGGALVTAAAGRFDVFAYQLQPAMALLRGDATRILLADEVGLGKTVQAGLVIAELIARGRAERVLVLTPAGLRDQWSGELSLRFGLQAVVADAVGMRQLARTLPLDVNPWTTTPVAIASIDYVKRPEVLPAVSACRWDVLAIDEAHAAVGDSERHDAVRHLAASASHVLLLTATPHGGDDRAYDALCGLGARPGDRLLVFRRTRQEIHGGPGRRTRMLRVGTNGAERQMLDALSAYHDAVRREHGSRALELSVLDKRTFSSAWSLAESVDRRRQRLERSPSGDDDNRQLTLPLDADGEGSGDDLAPEWPPDLELSDVALERRLLADLSRAARLAAARESKIAALRRLLRRCGESAVVFTEYRDTALHVSRCLGGVPVLHGGLSRDERLQLVAAFNDGRCRVIVATDAGGLGLNLQRRCRLVVNLELPWNPTRLEQRIGRVDRIGQRRRVHAVQLVGRGTGESSVLSRLQQRRSAADRVLDVETRCDPLGDASQQEAARVEAIRPFAAREDRSLASLESSRWWVARARRRLRIHMKGRAFLIFRARTLENGTGGNCQLIGIAAPSRLADGPDVRSAAETAAADWLASQTVIDQAYWRVRLDRERWIADRNSNEISTEQPGLFDHRIEQLRSAGGPACDAPLDARQHLASLETRAAIRGHVLDLMLVLLP